MEDSNGRSPIFYARVAGWIYLVAMALSLFTQMYVPGKIIDVPHNVLATAHNLSAFAGLYRIGIVVEANCDLYLCRRHICFSHDDFNVECVPVMSPSQDTWLAIRCAGGWLAGMATKQCPSRPGCPKQCHREE
jgi:hypothetical protein